MSTYRSSKLMKSISSLMTSKYGVAPHAKVLDLVEFQRRRHGLALGKVELNIKGVEAQALRRARLSPRHLAIIDCVLTTLDRNPELLESIGKSLESVGEGAGKGVGDVFGQGRRQRGRGRREGPAAARSKTSAKAPAAPSRTSAKAPAARSKMSAKAPAAPSRTWPKAARAARSRESSAMLQETSGSAASARPPGRRPRGPGQGAGQLAGLVGAAARWRRRKTGAGGRTVTGLMLGKEPKPVVKQLGSAASEEVKELSLAATQKAVELSQRRRQKRAEKHHAARRPCAKRIRPGIDLFHRRRGSRGGWPDHRVRCARRRRGRGVEAHEHESESSRPSGSNPRPIRLAVPRGGYRRAAWCRLGVAAALYRSMRSGDQ